ncbi:MAG TPA: NUDIX hydrolase [Deltaproteobacteria bacterium]|nr:NUDIX hydrolase [Deltaproteobacteria bacterium]
MKRQRLYCPYCAGAIERRPVEGRDRDVCRGCGTVLYENPLPVASAVVVDDRRRVLLVKRSRQPHQGMWCLPIGFAESGEDIDAAALRELEEETGVVGEVVRLIDVDTVESDFYGSLAVVTYEVRAVGGCVRPGDDASDARYFPLDDLPPLAWSSNDKAVRIFRDLYRDTWAMMDSFVQLFPDLGPPHPGWETRHGHGRILSDFLVKVIEKDREEIVRAWAEEALAAIPALGGAMDTLERLNRTVLEGVRAGLAGVRQPFDREALRAVGRELRRMGVRLPDILDALALSRKSIWIHVVRRRILSSPLEIYSTLELNNRIIFLYVRVYHHITYGYTAA